MLLYVVFGGFSFLQILKGLVSQGSSSEFCKLFYKGMQANMVMGGSGSSSFSISDGAEQGCLLTPHVCHASHSVSLTAQMEFTF